jgi:hypothetical protein
MAVHRKQIQVGLGILLIMVVGLAIWPARDTEPVYRGQRLSVWLLAGSGPDATAAVREAGTNAIPTLLRLLRGKDRGWLVKVKELGQMQHLVKVPITYKEERRATDQGLAALLGFKLLGSEARCAVPDLIAIGNENRSGNTRGAAILALGAIGPDAKEAIPSLSRWATNSDARVRFLTQEILNNFAMPERMVPRLISALHPPDCPWPGLKQDNQWVVPAAIRLGELGPFAKRAVPALIECLHSSDITKSDKALIVDALKRIDPAAAATISLP